jgi:adenylate cyclase
MAATTISGQIEDWLAEQSLRDTDLSFLLEGVCLRIHAAGLPIARAVIAWPMLHPLFDAEALTWNRGVGCSFEQFAHSDVMSPSWERSPFRYMLISGLDFLRRRLAGPEAMRDFPMIERLGEEGMTDYLASTVAFDIPRATGSDHSGVVVSWATDAVDGFSDGHIALLRRLNRGLAIACRSILLSRIATTIAETYLGRSAGGEVLAGRIRRGDGRGIRAVIWYSDLRESTALAESLTPDAFLGLLNHYFECAAGAVVASGGEVLDFIGDAVLAVFPITEDTPLAMAVVAATEAADKALALARGIDTSVATGGVRFDLGVALAVGDVMFGNIGIPARLAFSVIGPTVNTVARIEKATKRLGVPILATEDVAGIDPGGWLPLGAHPLDGVPDPVPLFGRGRALAVAGAAE